MVGLGLIQPVHPSIFFLYRLATFTSCCAKKRTLFEIYRILNLKWSPSLTFLVWLYIKPAKQTITENGNKSINFTVSLVPRKGYFDVYRKKCYQKETLYPYLRFQNAFFVRIEFEEHNYEATMHMLECFANIWGNSICVLADSQMIFFYIYLFKRTKHFLNSWKSRTACVFVK